MKNIFVGGLITSDKTEYKSKSTVGLEKKLIVRLMQRMWCNCAVTDSKRMAKQTPPDVECKKDIAYIDDGNVYHKLDVFYPKGAENKSLPVIIDIHGGGWMYATKDLNENYCRALADRGFTVFSISYRLVPDVTVVEQLQSIAVALDWIDSHMGMYPCDRSSVMLTGDSAGGQLSVYTAIISKSERLQKIFDVRKVGLDFSALLLTSPVPFMKTGILAPYTRLMWGKDYRKKATYGYMDLDEIVDCAPVPPTYLITSSGDSMAHTQTHKTAKLFKSKGIKTVIKDYPRHNGKSLPHVFSVLEPFNEIGKEAIDDAVDFFKSIIHSKNTEQA